MKYFLGCSKNSFWGHPFSFEVSPMFKDGQIFGYILCCPRLGSILLSFMQTVSIFTKFIMCSSLLILDL